MEEMRGLEGKIGSHYYQKEKEFDLGRIREGERKGTRMIESEKKKEGDRRTEEPGSCGGIQRLTMRNPKN